MDRAEFADATLLVLAHGSTVNAGSAEPARRHAETLRRRGLFAAVEACFWAQEPSLPATLAAVRTPRVFVAPLFIGAGYFVEEVIPVALGLSAKEAGGFARVQCRSATASGHTPARCLYYCHPAGTHPGMTDVLLARAREVVARHPFPRAPRPAETALVIAGHGTGRSEKSSAAVDAQVALIRARGEYAEVHAAFMEEAPFIADVYTAVAARNLVVVPFFISDGLHVVEDIPVLLGEAAAAVKARLEAGAATWRNPTERHGKRVWYAPGLGFEPLLAEVILERVREAATWVAEAG